MFCEVKGIMSGTEINIEIPEEDKEPEKKIAADVEKVEDKVERLETEVREAAITIPEHEHEHFHADLDSRMAKLEEISSKLIDREVERSLEDQEKTNEHAAEIAEPQQEFTPEETTAEIQEEAKEAPKEELTIIEPPPERSKPENPGGFYGFLKKMGF